MTVGPTCVYFNLGKLGLQRVWKCTLIGMIAKRARP